MTGKGSEANNNGNISRKIEGTYTDDMTTGNVEGADDNNNGNISRQVQEQTTTTTMSTYQDM
jgi:hypothetical protein